MQIIEYADGSGFIHYMLVGHFAPGRIELGVYVVSIFIICQIIKKWVI